MNKIAGLGFRLIFLSLFCVTFYLSPITANAQGGRFANTSFEGILDTDSGPSICMQGAYVLRDCQGKILIRVSSIDNGPDLTNLMGQYVRISGNDVGVECPIVGAKEVTALGNRCINPQQPERGRREGILTRSADGGYELRDCSGNLLQTLNIGSRFPRLDLFVGKYIQVKGERGQSGERRLRLRSITIKSDFCTGQ